MADIATLGFDIDTAPLRRANTELTNLVRTSGQAEQTVGRLAQRFDRVGNAAAGASQSFRQVGNAASGAAAAMQAAAQASAAAATAAARAQAQQASAAVAAAQAQRNLAGAIGTSTQAANASLAAHNNLGRSIHSMTGLYRSLAALLAGRAVAQASDTYTQLQNTLRLVGLEGEQLLAVERALFEAASKNGVAINDVSDFYRKASQAQKTLGASSAEMVRLTETVTAALRIQGTPAKQAEGALRQLTQAMTSANVRAEEFNSLQEGAFPVLQAAANGIQRYGGNVMKMRADVIAGKLTNQEFFQGILAGSQGIIDKAKLIRLTMASELTSVETSWINLVGQMDKATGASDSVVSGLKEIQTWLDNLAKNEDFLATVKAEFEALKSVIKSTVAEIQMLMNAVGFVKAEVQKTVFATRTQNLNQVEKDIEDLEGQLRGAMQDKSLAILYNPKALGAAADKVDEITTALEGLRKEQDQIRQSMSHGVPVVTVDPVNVVATKIDTTKTKPDALTPKADKGAKKLENAYEKINRDALQYIETKKREIETMNLSDEAAAALAHKMELLHKAQDAGIKITPQLAAQYEALAQKMAAADAGVERARFMKQNQQASEAAIAAAQVELDVIGMTEEAARAYRIEQTALNEAKRQGTVLTQADTAQIAQNAAAMSAIEQKVSDYREALAFAKDIASGFFSDLREGLNNGRTLWESFGSAAMNVLNRIADKLVNMAVEGLFDYVFTGFGSSAGASPGASGKSGSGMMGGIGDLLGNVTKLFDFGGSSSSSSGGMLSGIGDWFGGLFGSGGGAGGATSIPASAFGGGSAGAGGGIGTAAGAGSGFASGSGWASTMGTAGGMMGMAGGALGIATGAMGLMSGGKKTTGQTIGSVGQMVGGALMMIPTGYTQIIGAVIMALSAILPSLFGGEPPTITNQEYGQLSYGPGGFTTSGGAWGPDANAKNLEGPLSKVGQTMDKVFDAFGGVKDAGKVWGIAMESFSQQKGDWSFSNATSFLVGPGGEKRQWGMGSTDSDIGMESAAVTATINSILEGAVGEISANMRKTVSEVNLSGKATFESLGTVIAEIMAFDKAVKLFGTDITDAEKQITAIGESFNEMYNLAAKYGLAQSEVNKIDAERNRLALKATEAFTNGISDAILGFSDPLTVSLRQLERAKQDDIATNAAYVKLVPGYVDQAANLEQLYYLRRNQLIEEANQEALAAQEAALAAQKAAVEAAKRNFSTLDELIKRLTPGGDLSGEGALGTLMGLQGRYAASSAQAMASPADEEIIAQFVSDAAELAEFSKTFHGGGTGYIQGRDQIISDALRLQQLQGVPPSQSTQTMGGQPANTNDRYVQLLDQFEKLLVINAELMAKLDRAIGQGRRV